MIATVKRMWINQPSTLDPMHREHGTSVLAVIHPNGIDCEIYYLSGDIVSADAKVLWLSDGWR